jgi:CO/xanthine dehydrogenase Mo-binding subunit
MTVIDNSRALRRPGRPPQGAPVWKDELRYDAIAKVTGEARYLNDMPPLAGEARAVVLRSPHSHARIVRLDSSRALAIPGVLGVLDRDHLGDVRIDEPISEYLRPHDGPPGWLGGKHLVCVDKVLYDGDIVAMVAAEDEETAQAAFAAIDVEYEVLPAVFSYEDAVAEGGPVLHESLGNNLAWSDSLEWGDVDAGMAGADRIIEEDFYGGNVFHHPMEPSNSCVVRVTDGEVDIWTSVHQAFVAEEHIERILGIPRENIRLRIPYIGGGFGAKQVIPELIATVELARRVGRPLRYVATESDSFRTTSRHAMRYRAKLGLSDDGRIVALDVFLEVDTGAYFTGAALVTHNACISAWGCYRIPHFRVRGQAVFTNKVPSGSFRATGKNQTTLGIECTIDSAARQLGIDPVAFRRRNALRRGEYPTDEWTVRGVQHEADVPAIDTDFDDLLTTATEGIGWNEPRDEPAAEYLVRGRGVALSLRHGAQGGGRAHALVEIDKQGKVRVVHNAPELGTGVYTILAVTAARCLGVPQGDVVVTSPDTAKRVPFRGTSAQRTTVQMGNAVRAACDNLERELVDAAVQTFGGRPPEWRIEGGRAWHGQRSFSFAEVLQPFQDDIPLRAVGSYSYAASEDTAFGGLDHWAPGAAAVEVEVDMETGEVRLLRLCGVGDAGKAIHHLSARRQIEGGAVLGIGLSLFEDTIYAGGHLQNGHIRSYRLPAIGDMPAEFTSVLIENADGPGPFGAKGLAQTSLPCIPPAVGAAIRDAIGRYVRSTPYTPEKVLAAIDEKDE